MPITTHTWRLSDDRGVSCGARVVPAGRLLRESNRAPERS